MEMTVIVIVIVVNPLAIIIIMIRIDILSLKTPIILYAKFRYTQMLIANPCFRAESLVI